MWYTPEKKHKQNELIHGWKLCKYFVLKYYLIKKETQKARDFN